ncbi:MAG: pyridoxal phosphate-dependent aminotransferase [Gammaproteobacteria bacterium]|nr:pyridoxal phosphate-dependent aminotransferase [Gammaproteobacteria bacterium]MCI0590365.1 pyridoxal phosphate-dependent aminotransferase [Gammaproteobacteria bacterium]
MKVRIANRVQGIAPFYVMGLLARAHELEAQGRSVIHMEIGEPDFITPEPIIEAARRALAAGYTHYTPTTGLPHLREAIAGYYKDCYGVRLSPERVIVTPGASGALQLALNVLINPGDEVLVADPSYPCYRHLVRLMDGVCIMVPVGAQSAYQFTSQTISRRMSKNCVAVIIASPSNPTGTLMNAESLGEIVRMVEANGARCIVDEIYHGLVYEDKATTALTLSSECFVINSFSKYFGMTGWRLGWLVAPEPYISEVDKLAQNIFLAPPTPAQHAALAAFTPETQEELERRRTAFCIRRDYLLPELRGLGFEIPITPQGAFYLYANCERIAQDSYAFAIDILERAGVAITPGADFGSHAANEHVRFAYTTGLEKLEEGVQRLRNYLS